MQQDKQNQQLQEEFLQVEWEEYMQDKQYPNFRKQMKKQIF